MTYLLTFLQSNFIEIPFYCVAHYFLKREKWNVRDFGHSVARTTLANLVTHPIVFFGFLGSGSTTGLTWIQGICLAEIFAIVGEIFLHRFSFREKFDRKKWWILILGAIVANLVSWELGPCLTYFAFLK